MIQTDMFISKEGALLNWCKQKHYFSKADVMQYGLDNYYLRAVRTCQEFVVEGKIRKLDKDECIFRGFRGKMGWYEINEKYLDKEN